MIQIIHSNASYSSELKARSRAVGHFFVGSQIFKNTRETNGAIHTVSNIMKNFMVSSTEAEVGYFFQNVQEAEPIRTNLHKMGHTQPATSMQTENSATNVISNNTVRQKQSKATDM